MIDHGMYVKQLKVEVYPMELKLCLNSDMENCHLKAFSRADTIGISPDAFLLSPFRDLTLTLSCVHCFVQSFSYIFIYIYICI